MADEKLFRPLHKACQAQNLDLVKLFLNKGAEINVYTKKGITPLHLAAINQNTQVGIATDWRDNAYGILWISILAGMEALLLSALYCTF